MGKYVCTCGFIYDPAKGDAARHIPSGVSFEELPHDWLCPVCGVRKREFSPW
ncbi:MAG: rubredoxin [Nitrospirae bacterium]|nr:rubredoxin [Nitrospirota bacterium]